MISKFNIPCVDMEQVPVHPEPNEHDIWENNVGGCQLHFYMPTHLIFFIIIVTRSYRTFLSLASQPKGKNGRTSPKDRNFSFFFERKVNKRKKRRHARHPHI